MTTNGRMRMSLRDYFAGQAMRGFNSEMVRYDWGEGVTDKAAETAYRIADAMLRARKRPPES